jgi:dTDP-4-amino-4,6-dideoxygalactose transaminase
MTAQNGIPFLDLVTPHKELREEIRQVFEKALDTAGFIGGAMLEGFEQDFAKYCDTEHCVGVSSGTDALRFALIGLGIGSGDLVVTVPNTFIATTEAISQAGARPVFVDIDEVTYNMDPQKLQTYFEQECDWNAASGTLIEKKNGGRVAAIMPVHLYGQMVDMDSLMELAERYNLVVIEDSCQAHGAEYFSKKQNRWCKAGSMGRAAAFSFYPGKNLGACGEAGAVTTSDAELAKKMRMLRDHGQAKKYYHDVEGYNGRLDSIQAGILHVKLKQLPEWTKQRQVAAAEYGKLLSAADCGTKPPVEPSWSKAVYHLYVVRVQNRDEFMKTLAAAGVATAIHYPIPLHLQNAYKSMGYQKGDFPVAEKVAPEIVSLPMFPGLRPDQQTKVVDEVANFVSLAKVG